MMKQLLHTLREGSSAHASANLIDEQGPLRSGFRGRPTYDANNERRKTEREVSVIPCSYAMIKVQHGGAITMASGNAYTVNPSAKGILLLMGYAPTSAQCLEVNIIRSFRHREAFVLEARWSQVAYADSEGVLYMVGCRRIFGPCRFVEF